MDTDQSLVHFFYEEIAYERNDIELITTWVANIFADHNAPFSEINYIFCSDDFLLKVNQDYLQHDYYTDIITFCNSKDPVQSDIFISIDRVKENAEQLDQSFDQELLRVMAHGLLHLIGLDDKTEAGKQEMRAEETRWVERYSNS